MLKILKEEEFLVCEVTEGPCTKKSTWMKERKRNKKIVSSKAYQVKSLFSQRDAIQHEHDK